LEIPRQVPRDIYPSLRVDDKERRDKSCTDGIISHQLNKAEQTLKALTPIGIYPFRSDLPTRSVQVKYCRLALIVSLPSSRRICPSLIDGRRNLGRFVAQFGSSNTIEVGVVLRRGGKVWFTWGRIPEESEGGAESWVFAVAILCLGIIAGEIVVVSKSGER
jgi:hypothetical protein